LKKNLQTIPTVFIKIINPILMNPFKDKRIAVWPKVKSLKAGEGK